jgi:hypothetical protein
MSDNSGATKTMRKTNVGPWQQGNKTGGYNGSSDDRLPSSPANREDNNAAVDDNQGNTTAEDVNGGNADNGTLSDILVATNTPNHNNATSNNDANYKDAARKKTLMRDTTMAGTGSSTSTFAVILPLHNNDIGGSQ